MNNGKVDAIRARTRTIWTLARKNIQLYFKKGPVIIFGFMFPFFLLLSWVIGRDLENSTIFVGICAMSAFFSSTAISPVVLPIETKEKSLERQLASPLSIGDILAGIISASTLFSGVITYFIALVMGLALGISITSFWDILVLIISVPLLCFAGSLIGVLASSNPTEQTSDVMVIINLIKFPLVFISGIFIPLSRLHGFGRIASYISPLTPFVDILHSIADGSAVLPAWANLLFLIAWILILFAANLYVHPKTMEQRFAGKSKGPKNGSKSSPTNAPKKGAKNAA